MVPAKEPGFKIKSKGFDLNPSYDCKAPTAKSLLSTVPSLLESAFEFKKVDHPNSNKRVYPGLKYKTSNN